MTNRELYNLVKESFPDVVGGYWEGYPATKYSNDYLLEKLIAIEEKLGTSNYHDVTPWALTQRQQYLALDVMYQCRISDTRLKGDAIHQFADCIDNFREKEREMNHIEHLLYYTLLGMLIQTTSKLQCQDKSTGTGAQ